MILLSLTTPDPFVPQTTSYASFPSSTAVLGVLNTVLGIDEKPKEPRLRVLEVCSELAEHGMHLDGIFHIAIGTMLRCGAIQQIDQAIQHLINNLVDQTLDGNRADFCHYVCQFYHTMITSAMKNDQYLRFDDELDPSAIQFMLFFVRNDGIPEIKENTDDYQKWLEFFLTITEKIYTPSEDEEIDCKSDRRY